MDRLIYKLCFLVSIFHFYFTVYAQNEVHKDSLITFRNVDIEKLGEGVNSELDEYWPAVTADEEKIFFTRKSRGSFEQEDFYVSDKINNVWQKAYPLAAINTSENEGAQTISADGRFFVFTACNRSDGFGSCDLYYTIKIGDNWIKPMNMGDSINTAFWETQPSLSADGKKLYFVSNRAEGKGKMDIWETNFLGINERGRIIWSKPKNLNINTPENELSPFIHHNGTNLYFASDGYGGYGGLDLFFSKKIDDVNFSIPQNLGNNINTSSDETGFIVSISGEKAYFASALNNSKDKNIYSLTIPQSIKPKPPAGYFKGKIFNQVDNSPIFAELSVINKNDEHDKQLYYSDIKNGNYLICLNQGNEYLLYVSADGFMYYSESINTRDSAFIKSNKNIYLTPIAHGEKVILKHIYFDFDSYQLQEKSHLELENLIKFLNLNPSINILVAGHTDHIGPAVYNLNLSIQRAKSVYEYLSSHGIKKDRLSFKGFGFNQPIDTAKTREARIKNRRTEIIISNTKSF